MEREHLREGLWEVKHLLQSLYLTSRGTNTGELDFFVLFFLWY